ncbi:hypothetical protein [Acidithiobacillus concretivorus]|uniref:Tetratricopeptide repeat protein n=1 Tax=Acidithiobacillus concretivorus TaxID=3063952 RepID=A0ABS5ZTI3_9PROT|nr:hypothetical protein [Acidithiobacillus concretivorus]MBU2739901.1 hypothetical protein [Acidithiobacillus concretivorus]
MPLTATKTNELTNEINALVKFGIPQDNLHIPRLNREIEKIRDVDANEFLMLKGMLAVFQHDKSLMRETYDKAIHRSGRHPEILENYACSLMFSGDLKESIAIVRESIPTQSLILLAWRCGAYHTAYEKALLLLGDNIIQYPHLSNSKVFLEKNNLNEDQVIEVVDHIAKAVWEAGYHINGGYVASIEDDILHTLRVPASVPVESLLDLEDRIDDHFSTMENRIQRKGFSYSLEITEKSDLEAA